MVKEYRKKLREEKKKEKAGEIPKRPREELKRRQMGKVALKERKGGEEASGLRRR